MTFASSRLGYVYRHDDQHFTQDDLRIWLPILKSLHTRWLTLVASSKRTIPETFLTGLLDAGIEPIVLVRGILGELNPNTLQPLLRSYARWGVQYVAVFDRPNLRCTWMDAEWNHKGIVERFLEHTVPILEFQRSVGLTPVLPPLQPGGDYWDTAFLRSTFEALSRRGRSDLLEDLHLAIYAWTNNKPLDWGSGGPSRWPEARPYYTPPNCQDQIGFRAFEWYADLANKVSGYVPKMLVVAGGAIPDPASEKSYSQPQIEQNVSILRALADMPDYVLNFSFDCLSADPATLGCNLAWYPEPTKPAPIVEAIQKVLHSQEKSPSLPTAKTFSHYLLLPDSKALHLAATELASFIQAHKPILGFSENEARMARKVTLVGREEEFSQTLQRDLIDAGCVVDRISTGEQTGDKDSVSSASTFPHKAIRYSPLGGS